MILNSFEIAFIILDTVLVIFADTAIARFFALIGLICLIVVVTVKYTDNYYQKQLKDSDVTIIPLHNKKVF
jgi:hypothetical protein